MYDTSFLNLRKTDFFSIKKRKNTTIVVEAPWFCVYLCQANKKGYEESSLF